MNKLKVLMVLIMGAIVVFIMRENYYSRVTVMNIIYSDIYFTRLAVETQQYTRQIEYGLKNGKSLDNFYKIETVLSDVRKCSSYISGAYIVTGDLTLRYSLSDKDITLPQRIRLPEKDSIYALHRNGQRYIMAVSIYGRTEEPEGYLLLDLSDKAIVNSMAEMHSDSLVQTVIIGILSFLLGTVFIIHFCRKKETVLYSCAKAMSVSMCIGLIVDTAISAIKLYLILESLIQHSASNIVMALQNALNTVIEKGVTINRIYDLNSWLLNRCQPIPFIENLIYDKGYQISAIIYEGHTLIYILTYITVMVLVIICLAVILLLICLIFKFIDKLINKLKQKRSNA